MEREMELTKNEWGNLCRKAFLKDLYESWGELEEEGLWFISKRSEKKVLTLYSKLGNDWFFGISKDDWEKWDDNSYLALIMRDGLELTYLMLNPTDSKYLISKLKIVDNDSKKIHIKMPNFGKIKIQQWEDFPCQEQIRHLSDITHKEILDVKLAKKKGLDEFL